MFGIGMPEMILILVVALIILGPKKLPDLAKSLGRAMREFKSATSEFKESMEIGTELNGVKKAYDELNQDPAAPLDTPAEEPADAVDPASAEATTLDEQPASTESPTDAPVETSADSKDEADTVKEGPQP